MRAMAQEEMGRGLTDMDYKFFFYPWYIDETYELVDDFPITQETCDYFATLKAYVALPMRSATSASFYANYVVFYIYRPLGDFFFARVI